MPQMRWVAGSYLGRKSIDCRPLEQFNVRSSVIPALLKVLPGPLSTLLVHFVQNGILSKLEQCSRLVGLQFAFGRTETAILMLARVEMEKVDHRKRITILVLVEDESEFFKQELGVCFGHFRGGVAVHNESTGAGDGLEYKLMLRRVGVGSNELVELGCRFFSRITCQRRRIGVEISSETLELGKLVYAVFGIRDKDCLPVLIRGDGRKAIQRHSCRERVPRY
jgi:hypothetical protein